MPDKKLTDSEIVKALEICSKGIMFSKHDCKKCPYYAELCCERKLKQNALDLINRLQEEKEALINGQETLQKYIADLQAENESLTKTVEVQYDSCLISLKIAKAEAYKEFAEEIFELFPADKPNTVISRVTVKHILKELVGE